MIIAVVSPFSVCGSSVQPVIGTAENVVNGDDLPVDCLITLAMQFTKGTAPQQAQNAQNTLVKRAEASLPSVTPETPMSSSIIDRNNKLFAQLNGIAFCRPESIANVGNTSNLLVGQFDLLSYYDNDANGVRMYAISAESNITAIIFRGSADNEDWNKNVAFLPKTPDRQIFASVPSGSLIHRGFEENFISLKQGIDGAISAIKAHQNSTNKPLYISGHSLGGAMAFMAAYTLKTSGLDVAGLYTVGAPRIGNSVLVDHMAETIGVNRYYRVVNWNDPVPHLGLYPGGSHPRYVPELFYSENNDDFLTCSYDTLKQKSCSAQFSCDQLDANSHGLLGTLQISRDLCF